MTLNIYKSTVDDLDLVSIANEFVVVNTGTQAQGVRELLTALNYLRKPNTNHTSYYSSILMG